MNKMKCLSLLLALVLLAGCTPQGAAPGGTGAPVAGAPTAAPGNKTVPQDLSTTAIEDTVTVAMVSEASQLDPQGNAVTQPDAIINVQLYEGLVRMNNETGQLEPWLAERWEQTNDKTWRFYIRQGVKFHDGTELTTDDVLFTIQRGKQSAAKEYCWSAVDAENTKIVDKYTIDVATYEPYPALLAMMADNGALIINKAYFEATDYDQFVRNPMGTGPWSFVEWIAGDSVIMKRNDSYWGEKPYFGNLVIRTISDDTTRALSLETGEVDVVIEVLSSQIEYLRSKDTVNIHAFPSMAVEYVGFNCTLPELGNPKVRQALRYAVDLPGMVDIAYGVGVTADVADGIFTTANINYIPAEGEYAYTQDIEKAKALLAEAGYPDGFDATIICKDTASRVSMCEMLKNAWAQIGVNLDIQVMDIGTYYDIVQRGDAVMFLGGFVCLANDGDMVHDVFYSTSGFGTNLSGYKNPAFDKLADAGRYELDPAKRLDIYKEIQNFLRSELPWMPVAFAYETQGVRATLTGADLDKNGQPRFQFIRPAA